MPTKPSHLDSYLSVLKNRDEEQWEWARNNQRSSPYWFVQYTGFSPPCKFRIHLNPLMIYLYCVYDSLKIYSECRLALYRYMLRQNEELSAAKLGLSHDGKVSLMVEWPTENLSFPTFDTLVRLLLNYHQIYFNDIQLVAQDIELKDHLLELDRYSYEEVPEVELDAS
jgi:hypothetical protein